MSHNIVVVAHFDAGDNIDGNFSEVLLCLEAVFDVILLVTTSNISLTDVSSFSKLKLIKRPNIGYDFYSYRVGYECAVKNYDVASIMFTNSSYFVADSKKYIDLLIEMRDFSLSYDVVGLTSSNQIDWHIQSYLLLISGRLAITDWVSSFIGNIQPHNTKFEIILNYEIGFSQKMLENNASIKVVFQPSMAIKKSAYKLWLKKIIESASFFDWMTLRVFRNVEGVNWTHFAAAYIAKQYGLVKAEVLRTNPHKVDKQQILDECAIEHLTSIQAAIHRSSLHYRVAEEGLSVLVEKHGSLPGYRSVHFGVPRRKGVAVAVVVHLFYYDLLEEIKGYLGGIVEPFDLYVTTPFEGDVHRIIDDCSDLASSVTVHISENRGRDIGPFLALYLSNKLDRYDAVLKLHSKKSKYSQLGDEWRRSIYFSLMQNSFTVRKVLELIRHENVGLLGPHEYYLSNDNFWGANRLSVKNLLLKAGVITPEEEVSLGFFAGSMFWFSPSAISPLKNIPLGDLDFVHENGMQDGTLAHALERVFCSIARAQGYRTSSLKLAGAEINNTETICNKVPVL